MTSAPDAVLQQARLQLSRQEVKIDQLRTISGVVLAGAGVVAGLFAPELAKSARGWTIAATVAFIGCVALAATVLAPKSGLKFSEGLDTYLKWIDDHGDEDRAAESFTLALAANLDASRSANHATVEEMATYVQWQTYLFALEVVLWAIAALTR